MSFCNSSIPLAIAPNLKKYHPPPPKKKRKENLELNFEDLGLAKDAQQKAKIYKIAPIFPQLTYALKQAVIGI